MQVYFTTLIILILGLLLGYKAYEYVNMPIKSAYMTEINNKTYVFSVSCKPSVCSFVKTSGD